MNLERWQHIQDVFEVAVALDVYAREAYLDQACAGNPSLRDEVASLLRASESPGPVDALGDELVAPLVSFFNSDAEEGAHVGPYRIMREIGRGGMGVVYLAERADGQFE